MDNPTPSEDAGKKLGPSDLELLTLAGVGEIEVSVGHPIASRLSDLGLLELGGSSFGRGGGLLYGRFAKITPAGRIALEKQDKPNG